MTQDKKKLLENFIRREVRKSLKEDHVNDFNVIYNQKWISLYRKLKEVTSPEFQPKLKEIGVLMDTLSKEMNRRSSL